MLDSSWQTGSVLRSVRNLLLGQWKGLAKSWVWDSYQHSDSTTGPVAQCLLPINNRYNPFIRMIGSLTY